MKLEIVIHPKIRPLVQKLAREGSHAINSLLTMWHQACKEVLAESVPQEILTRAGSWSDSGYTDGIYTSGTERETFPQKGIRLFDVADAGIGPAGTPSGWQLYLLESGDLLVLKCRTGAEREYGSNIGRESDFVGFITEQTQISNKTTEGLDFLIEKIEDIRRTVREEAASQWEVRRRQGLGIGDATSDWFESRRCLGIPDDIYL